MKSPIALMLFLGSFTQNALAHASEPCQQIDLAAAMMGGDRGGNAGEGPAAMFRETADQVLEWVKRGRLAQINTNGHDRERLTNTLLTQKWKVCMIDGDSVIVDGKLRTCRNSFDPSQPDLIECAREAYLKKETLTSRYALVFHELLGVAQVEKNLEFDSDDSISRQILRFVERTYHLSDQIVGLMPARCSFNMTSNLIPANENAAHAALKKKGYVKAFNPEDAQFEIQIRVSFFQSQSHAAPCDMRGAVLGIKDRIQDRKVGEAQVYRCRPISPRSMRMLIEKLPSCQ